MNALLADALVVAHFAYMAFVVVGEVAIVAGWCCRWEWVRNLWFRLAHLAAIVVVAAEALGGVLCPLTRWEYELRVRAGCGAEDGTFVGRLVRSLLYYDLPSWVFTTAYVVFALVVLLTLVLVPPRRRKSTPRG